MNNTVETISLSRLAIMFLPALLVIFIYMNWSMKVQSLIYALFRMLIQLILIGYCLNFLFQAELAGLTLAVLIFMLCVSAWIALFPLKKKDSYLLSLLSISVAGVSILLLVVLMVLQQDPWYEPQVIIPLAGMIFSTAMNSVSMAAERFESDILSGRKYVAAREDAMQAAMIPAINSLLAVGLVSLPGMMTGQILSGVEPLIAARYQILVMTMLFAASGLSAAIYLFMMKFKYES